jgi:acetyltransferase-like isoleucine patch superfamily enzyme
VTGTAGVLVDNSVPAWKSLIKGSSGILGAEIDTSYYICAFTPGIRYQISLELEGANLTPGIALFHPSCSIDQTMKAGVGTTSNRLVSIGSYVAVGDHVHLNRSCSIGHNSGIEDFASIGPGATITGSVQIGRGAFVGAGAVILPGVSVGNNSTVGAGAVVTRDVPDFAVTSGNPARVRAIGDTGYGGHVVR